jgi:hypothetical protein
MAPFNPISFSNEKKSQSQYDVHQIISSANEKISDLCHQ